jgi:hypothetical protein
MNAGAWNTNDHKQAIVKLSEEKAPACMFGTTCKILIGAI